MREILFASTNISKIEEVKSIFNKYAPKIKIVLPSDIGLNMDGVEEDGKSYLENAYIKAMYAYGNVRIPVIADDSGYEIKQFNGMPGLYTHRLYKEYPVEKLDTSKSMDIIQHSAVCFVHSILGYDLFEHKVKGQLLNTLRGDHLSYYMNAMIPDTYKKTFVELGDDFINEYSARALCMKELIKKHGLNKLGKNGRRW